jgi:hypothetical protein
MSDNIINEGFKCDICGKTYKTKNSLAVHKSRYHSNTENIDNANENDNIEINEPNDINITEEQYSEEDLNKAKNDINDMEQEIENDANVKAIEETIENLSEDDGKEMYLLLMDIVGNMSGVDIDKDIPNIENKAKTRGRYLAYTVNKYSPSIKKYAVPLLLVIGIGTDIISIRKLGKMKKEMEKLNSENKKEGEI